MPKPNGWKTFLTWTIAAFGVAAVVGGLGFFAVVGYARLYEGRVFPGVRVLGVRLDGLTADEARATLNKAVDEALKDGLRFRYVVDSTEGKAREVTLDATTVALNDRDMARDLVRYVLDKPVVAAMGYGRSDNIVFDTFLRWRARVSPVNLQAEVTVDDDGITNALTSALKDAVPAVRNASLDVTWNPATGRAETNVTPERAGKKVRFDTALATLRVQAERLRFQPILLEEQTESPSITTKDAEALVNIVQSLLAHAPFRLAYEDATSGKKQTFTVATSTFATWLNAVRTSGVTELTIDQDRMGKGLRTLAPDIEKTAKKGSLVIEDGKLKSFEAGTEGIAIDDTATREAILDAWSRKATTTTFTIQVVREEPVLVGKDPERLGIKEIVGIGRSNFSGSPANRRKNIATGVKKVNGSLIEPGAEFSLLQTLGPVTAANGWLPELVIKGNKTEPELGGGLCQIGTTTFRAALGSGLPITQRTNHSYRVRYYEPAGTDATIYEPRPDFRFLNDMKTHVLIHAYLDGDDVIYEFWGTKDGRTVNQTKPRIFNVTSPPPGKLVETLDLPPGKKKCTEIAHAGADAEFTYTVTYADGTEKKEVFRSHYRPWQAICLVGVEKLSEPPAEEGTEPTEGSADVTVVN
ncbi:hypothetical protein A3E39_01910 [Candidatus Uhrbacteria bacterium RIFCSPHIGHO2_12_FULL_60_25]|uniref:YoaR-like putative peptidoglycan binding domain-containing protein n=1 Tax=Candidatus Uhrbacteria bacterium RIFCSPHIGHO2_12_FULL_60_25 TaxID=1802399 RepID=A0A1F7UPU2_9BACT|nr:MAG: hypothetical protein A3D73_02585 [Candidatus Uhrbacteria bacterium RIFCSPHIGHO2_02_FULL_60_44]OGL79764.1 MAG: hypothetical protein A3E39_01910 [Candidatus Uhrbacteria bacterium RIFCSPHIGHO2_12_FULL_60_25]